MPGEARQVGGHPVVAAVMMQLGHGGDVLLHVRVQAHLGEVPEPLSYGSRTASIGRSSAALYSAASPSRSRTAA